MGVLCLPLLFRIGRAIYYATHPDKRPLKRNAALLTGLEKFESGCGERTAAPNSTASPGLGSQTDNPEIFTRNTGQLLDRQDAVFYSLPTISKSGE